MRKRIGFVDHDVLKTAVAKGVAFFHGVEPTDHTLAAGAGAELDLLEFDGERVRVVHLRDKGVGADVGVVGFGDAEGVDGLHWNARALDWFDAVGIAIYAVFGTWKSLTLGVPLLPAMMMGVITACVGGIIRDVLAGEPSILLKPEIYVAAAALASGLFGLLMFLGLPVLAAAIISALAGFALRAMAIWKGWAIPAYRG